VNIAKAHFREFHLESFLRSPVPVLEVVSIL
jgi:hypothetical protein